MDAAHPFDLPSDFDFSQLGSDYATGDYTIDEISGLYGISRDTFNAIKRAAPTRWKQNVKDNLWWSDLTASEEDLVERVTLKAKADRVDRKARRRIKREEKRAAERWWRLEKRREVADDLFAEWAADYEPVPVRIRVGPNRALDPAALLLPIHDLHYGKYACQEEVGVNYNRQIARERALEAVHHVLEQACRVGQVEQIITVCGTSDYLHIDQDTPASTTAGTPQDADGTIGEIIAGGQALAIELIDMMRSVAPVEVVYCEGNHDRIQGLQMHSFLRAWYRHDEDITYTKDRRPRQYFTYGVTRGCIHHGEVKKSQLKTLGNVIAREHGFGQYTMVVSGHKHFRQADDMSGLMMHQCLSLSGSDRWHERSLYKSLAGLQAFVLDKEEGPIATPTWYV
jgi:3',5'-cyclic AMP phosphodiesterase CpdA